DSSHPSGDASGQMSAALAASSLAFRNNGDTAYADECLKYAQALQEFTKKYPGATYDGVGSMYSSGQTVDDVAWSEVWCQLAANDGELPSSYTPSYVLTGDKCYTGNNYDGYLYCWDKVWSGYAALLAEVGYNTNTYVNEMKVELSGQGGLSSSSYNAAGWGASRYNCALQMLAHHIAEATGDESYVTAAKFQMDTILGNNSTGYSFLLGYGDKWATRIHHRAANPGTGNPQDNTEALYTAYGTLVGGMDSRGNYADEQNSYQFTEPALDYNGCFALAIAPLVVKYGGDASSFPAKLASIAEINADYSFGNSSTPTTTTESTTTTTATTTTTTESTTATTESTTATSESTTKKTTTKS
ncbi:MAG: glycoside hydrolase family 9 protein, partial [Oscillospiraceae bacterium]|nr:glycoside hydrolase family 9 protein [Oscillospiraceae bacterium]